jgi:glycosyltransferase involved in cell wall biosynthesis
MEAEIRILHIIPNLRKGGAERLAITICNELAKRENINARLVTFSSLNEYPDYVNEDLWDVVPASYVPSLTKKAQRNIAELQTYIEKFKPDIIHTHLWISDFVTHHIQYPQAKWFSHLHDNMSQLQKYLIPFSKQKITNWFERKILITKYIETDTRFIAIAHDSYAFAQKNLPPVLRQNVILLHNAVDIEHFARTHNQEKCAGKKINLLSVGSLVAKKNQSFLLSVVEYLHQKQISCELHILGEGPDRKKIEDYIEKKSLHNSVILHGNKNVEDFYKEADVFVHAATYEPFGLVIIEAMAAGLPVVCLDGKGNRDIIRHGKNGYIVYDKQVSEFAEYIIALHRNSNIYSAISKEALITASEYNIPDYIDKLLEIYQS